jgi:hypothetical protein
MDELGKEIAIDVGGGQGEYFAKRARAEPEKTFLVLEPKPTKPEKIPPNLHIIQWLSTQKSGLPLKGSSVDEANIHFLYGEIIDTTGRAISSKDTSAEDRAYRKLLRQLKRVLRNGARINILDVRNNILRVEKLLKEEGFLITSPPRKLENEEQTIWSALFFSSFKKGHRPESESFVLPMEIEASWNPK